MNSNSRSSTLQIDDASNDQQNSNLNPKKRSLPFELHCQIREFLPLEKGAQFLQLNHKLSQLCLGKVRQQYQQFIDNRVNLMFAQFHPEIVERIKTLENQCENSYVNVHFTPFGIEEIDEDSLKMAKWVGPRAVREAISSGTEHFLSCWIELYHILKRSKERRQEIYLKVDFKFHGDFQKLKFYCSPRPFPCPHPNKNWNFSRLFQQRLQKEYELRLDGWKVKINVIGKRREEKFFCMQKFINWDAKLCENMLKLIKYWKMARNSSDQEKWLKELLKDEEAMEVGMGSSNQ